MSASRVPLRPNVAALLLITALCVPGVLRADDQFVTMTDGRVVRGDTQEAEGGKQIRIDSVDKITAVAAAHVGDRKAAPADFDLLGYQIIGKGIVPLDPGRAFKGRVTPGHDWNGLRVNDRGRQMQLQIADEKHGTITVTYELATLTPEVAHYQGVEWDEYCYRPLRDFNDADLWYLLEKMIATHGADRKGRGWLEAAHFLRRANRRAAALRAIQQAGQGGGAESADIEAERTRIESMEDMVRLQKARWSVDRGMPEAGLKYAKEITHADGMSQVDREWLESYIGETEKNLGVRDAWRKQAADLATALGGSVPESPQPTGTRHGIDLVEPPLDWPVITADTIGDAWGERIGWIAAHLCVNQALALEANWKNAISGAADNAAKARLLWLGAWYGESLRPGMVQDAEGAWLDLDKVIGAAVTIAAWAASSPDARKDTRKEAAKSGDLPPALLRALVAHSHLRPPPADKRPYTDAYGKSGYRKLSAPTGDRKHAACDYLLQLPADYNPCRTYPLIVLWHGMNSTLQNAMEWFGDQAFGRGFIIAASEFVVDANEYRGTPQQHFALTKVIEDVSRSYRVDPDRVFLFGASLGGHGAWGCGMLHWERLAGVGSMIGGPFGLARMIAEVAVPQLPVYCIAGEVEPHVPETLRALSSWAHKNDYDVTYSEYKGRGHVGFPEEYPELLDWMLRKRRNPSPDRLDFVIVRDEASHKAWIKVDGFKGKEAEDNARAWPLKYLSRVTARWSGNKLIIDATDVSKIDVYFDRALCNFDEDVFVVCNGKETKVRVRADFGDALEACDELGDRGRFLEASKSIRVR